MKQITLLTGLFLMTIGMAKAQTPDANGVIYVKQDATGDGTSWSNAYGSLQGAINAANVKKVWVAKGEYQPTISGTQFFMKADVEIYGGFPNSGSPTMADRDFSTNETILKGNGSSVIQNNNNGLTPENALLDGFTITEGNRTRGGGISNTLSSPKLQNLILINNHATGNGGGMANIESSPLIINVTITENTAVYNGGGMLNWENSSPTLINVAFNENNSNNGAGMYNYDNSSPILTDVSFNKNIAQKTGGGMHNSSGSSPQITGGIFNENYSEEGGGIYSIQSSLTLSNLTISNNTATINGGGMLNWGNSSPTLINVNFNENNSKDGAGMYNKDTSSPILTDVSFNKNVAQKTGGGMHNSNGASPQITGGVFNENSSEEGGGVYNNQSSPTLSNLIISNNTAEIGGGIYNNESSPILTDVTINDNTVTKKGGGICNEKSSMTFNGGTVNNNTSVWNGGGISNKEGAPTFTNIIISNNYSSEGGGVFNQNSSPTFTDVTINNNASEWEGGGMNNYSNASVLLNNVTFNNNNAETGGGMLSYYSSVIMNSGTISENNAVYYAGGIFNTNSTLELNDVTISHNKASNGEGGGIINEDGTAHIYNSYINNNSANNGGGGISNSNATLKIEGGAIIKNETTTESGGGIFNYGNSSYIVLTDVEIAENEAEKGGGIATEDGTMHISNSLISYNSVTKDGGGIYFANNTTSLYATNVLINKNHAGIQGGGLYNYKASALLTNLTIADNTADMDGGAITNISSQDLRMNNCIVLGNSSGIETDYDIEDSENNLVQTGGATSGAELDGVPVSNTTPNEIFSMNTSPATSYYNLLVTPTNPAINGGSNYAYTDIAAYFLDDLDLDSNLRLCGDSIDIGAYEGGVVATHTITGDNDICDGTEVQLTASEQGGIWLVDANATIDNFGKLTNTTVGTATVYNKVTYTDGCVGVASFAVTTNPLPTVAINAINDDNTLCAHVNSVELSGTPANGTFSGNGVINSSFYPEIIGVGSHTITYTYTDDKGCTDEATATIKVVDCVGLEEANVNLLTVYPNPSNTGLFTLSVMGEELNQEEVLIYNALGQHIQSFVLHNEQQTIDLTNQARGVYILKVGTQTVRLVKK